MNTRKQFEKKMNDLSNDQIIEFINLSWDEPTGGFFREVGFEVLESRLGEEESDRIYTEIWNKHSKAA